jgi:hypothetical protein
MQRIPIMLFNQNMPNLEFIYSGQIEQIEPKNKDFIIILTDKNDEVISYLQSKFPALELKETKDSFGLSYYTME